jgi:hypothetical protein
MNNCKRYIFIFFVYCFTLTYSADKSDSRYYFGTSFGFNSSEFSHPDYGYPFYTTRKGFNFGINYEMNNLWWSIIAGLYVETRGEKINSPWEGDNAYKLTYGQIPLLLQYNIIKRRVIYNLYTGPDAGVNISSRRVDNGDEKPNKHVKPFDFGISSGAGIEIPIKRITLNLRVSYYYGLVKAIEEKSFPFDLDEGGLRNKNVKLELRTKVEINSKIPQFSKEEEGIERQVNDHITVEEDKRSRIKISKHMFFLSGYFGFGPSYLSSVGENKVRGEETELTHKTFSTTLDFQAGLLLLKNTYLSYCHYHAFTDNASPEKGIDSLFEQSRYAIRNWSNGLGITYFLTPYNYYLNVSAGIGQVHLVTYIQQSIKNSDSKSKKGYVIRIKFGKDWYFNNFGLGACLIYGYSKYEDNDVIPEWNGNLHFLSLNEIKGMVGISYKFNIGRDVGKYNDN